MGDDEPEPLAKTRTRRSNAGARMHEMIFNAEADPQYAQAFGDLLKTDDDSSDDEEYIPKDLETHNDADVDHIDDNDGEEDDNYSDDDSEDGSSDESDDIDEEDDNENEDEDEEEGDDDGSRKSQSLRARKDQVSLHVKPGSPSRSAYNSCKKICSVCLGDQSVEHDEIIECDSCGISVHESCYGVSGPDTDCKDGDRDGESVHSNISSESTEPWFCEPCRRSVKNPVCELCPNPCGIFKQTDTGRWIHMVCALYTRGVTFENIENLTDVSLLELNYALYGSKACTICEDRRLARSGICIGCDAGLCKIFFHATCAQKEGLLFESHSDEVDPYFAQCKQHADKDIIKKKKRLYLALHARLKRNQPEINSERIKTKLSEITRKPDPHLTRWTSSNPPPIARRASRLLLTSPSLIMRLTKKSELMGLDTKSASMSVQDEMETARQKWHIPPAFNLEFVAYCLDRTSRMANMKKQNVDLVSQNLTLKTEEARLRDKFNSMKEVVGQLRIDCDNLIKEARAIQKTLTATTGKHVNLPIQMEQLIARRTNDMKRGSAVKSPNGAIIKTSSTYGCGKCDSVKDQHLLALCDTCHSYIHIYCLDPPLTRVPKKTKFGGWQCSDCSEKYEEEQEDAIEEQNNLAASEIDGPRRLRDRIKFPDKYCHESMMSTDFWSINKKRSKKSSRSKSKKIKAES